MVLANKVKRNLKTGKGLLMMREINGKPDFIPNRNDGPLKYRLKNTIFGHEV